MAESRTLRSKTQRAMLWLAAEGRCERCGEALADDWQADHRVPWSRMKRTNVHEMQALCAACNGKKGIVHLRKHQRELQELLERIVAGRIAMPRFIGAHVCCGGGKQALAGIAAHYLIERAQLCDRVCWVVPNGTLREQAAESVLPGEWLARLLGHHLSLYESRNDLNPSKGGSGYVITYHALLADQARVNVREFERHRYLLVLDEPHHLAWRGRWQAAVQPLVERAAAVLVQTGTLDRNDRRPVYPFDYAPDGTVDTRSTEAFRWISYTVRDAIAEKVIIRPHFQHLDGRATWLRAGEELSAETLGNNRSAVWVALNSEYATGLLADCLRHWHQYRALQRRSKMLVVCATIRQARSMLQHARALGWGEAAIATSADDEADRAIRLFKGRRLQAGEREIDLLFTVAMAYEGLDVPAITHLACLTHIRSRPWIEQMLARAWRYDPGAGPYEQQLAYVFCPDDELMTKCIRDIEYQQQASARESDTDGGPDGFGGNREPDDFVVVTPTGSAVTEQRASEFAGESLLASETARYMQVAQDVGLPLSPIQVKQIIEANERLAVAGAVGVTNGRTEAPNASPQERLVALKANLDATVGEVARLLCRGTPELAGLRKRDINVEVKKRYGPREAMGEAETKSAIAWVRGSYGLD